MARFTDSLMTERIVKSCKVSFITHTIWYVWTSCLTSWTIWSFGTRLSRINQNISFCKIIESKISLSVNKCQYESTNRSFDKIVYSGSWRSSVAKKILLRKLKDMIIKYKTHGCQVFSNIKGLLSVFIKIYSLTNRPQVSFYFLLGQHEPGPEG